MTGCDQCGRSPLSTGAGSIKTAPKEVTRIYPNLRGAHLCATCRKDYAR